MSQPSKKPSFGQDLVEAMTLVLAHHRGEIELKQVLQKRRSSKITPKLSTSRSEIILLRLE
jgi:hypothetical protein